MTLDKAIKSYKNELEFYIKGYAEALSNKDFARIYRGIIDAKVTSAFTALLLKNGINPLVYMNEVPQCFMYKLNLDIKEITIPNNITRIGENAFEGCKNLKSIHIPNSVIDISEAAFNSCLTLTEIKLPNNINSIDVDTFKDCENLKWISIPNSVKEIGEDAFIGCSNLRDVYYTGSEEDWRKIKIYKYGNEELLNATIHYNS